MNYSKKYLKMEKDKLDELYLLKGEERLLKYIYPIHYIREYISKQKNIELNFLLNYLQKELHELLNSFLNGGYSLKGFILYPIIKDISLGNVKKMKMLIDIIQFLTNNGYNFSNSIGKFNKINNFNSNNFASLLSELYKDFRLAKKASTKLKSKNKLKGFNIKNFKKDLIYIQPLANLQNYVNRKLKNELLAFYLHGSFATDDYVKGWSDVDIFAIVDKEIVENSKLLLELRDKFYIQRKFFLQIDPLQHHGCMIISECDLDYYPETFFPINAMNYAKSLLDADNVNKIKVRSSIYESINTFFWFVNYFRKLHIEKIYRMNSYSTKFFLHSITLFPTLYLQARGINVYKKHSFQAAKKDFPKELWKPIEKVEKIRRNWVPLKVLPFVKTFAYINPMLWYQINSKFFNISKSNNINVKYLAEEMHKTSDYAWDKIKKELNQNV